MILQTLCLLLLVPAVLACFYQLALTAVALWPRRRSLGAPVVCAHRFAVVIPAHNEETTLPDALASCGDLDYPPEKIKVFVIADNCTDQTAAVATSRGAVCLARFDRQRRGKGPALAWALPHVLEDRPDAVIILDADCRLDRNALREFDRHLAAGEDVLQASYVAGNPDEGLVSYVAGVANLMENDLFYAPKSRLGLAVLLRGTGMVFRREVLERCPWHADSIVEDAEYTVRLNEAGLHVKFVQDTQVVSAFPNRQDQLIIQRSRWIGGTMALGRARSLRLMLSGLADGRLLQMDLGWTLLVCLRSLVLVELLAALLLCLGSAVWVPGGISNTFCLMAGGLVAIYGLMFAVAALRLGLSASRLRYLVQSPGIVLRLVLVAARSLVMGQPRRWEPTPR
jgi:cellulose synthase/poly-beta-1,6-N-acetylglucosamine synthase-like glycosyltransferase